METTCGGYEDFSVDMDKKRISLTMKGVKDGN